MYKEICQRCEFIKEGCEVDNDGYYYVECPECGFKHYEQTFCQKCFKIFDLEEKDVKFLEYHDICKECVSKFPYIFNKEELEVEFEEFKNENILFLKKKEDKDFIREDYFIYYKNKENGAEYMMRGKIYDLYYALRDYSPDLYNRFRLDYKKKDIRDGIFKHMNSDTLDREECNSLDFMNIIKSDKNKLKLLDKFYKNIKDKGNELFIDYLKKIRLEEKVRFNIKSKLLDFILYDKNTLGEADIYKIAKNKKEIIVYIAKSYHDGYNEEWIDSYYAFYFCRNGFLTKSYYADSGDRESIPKIKEEEYTIVTDSKFLKYIITDNINNPFQSY